MFLTLKFHSQFNILIYHCPMMTKSNPKRRRNLSKFVNGTKEKVHGYLLKIYHRNGKKSWVSSSEWKFHKFLIFSRSLYEVDKWSSRWERWRIWTSFKLFPKIAFLSGFYEFICCKYISLNILTYFVYNKICNLHNSKIMMFFFYFKWYLLCYKKTKDKNILFTEYSFMDMRKIFGLSDIRTECIIH